MRPVQLLFDFGGVVFRWQPESFMPRLLPSRANTPQRTRRLVADFFEGFGGDWGEFDRGALDADALVPRIATRCDLDPHEVRRVVDAIPDELQPVPETLALLDALRASGLRLYYLSNMPAPYADVLQSRHPLDEWFAAGVFSSRVGAIKPEPAAFAAAAARCGIDPGRTLFVDDSPANVAAALSLGWQALHFRDPAQCAGALRERGLL